MAKTYDEDGTETNSISERNNKKKKLLALNDGPSTPIKYYDGMGYMPNLGAGRAKVKKLKKGGA